MDRFPSLPVSCTGVLKIVSVLFLVLFAFFGVPKKVLAASGIAYCGLDPAHDQVWPVGERIIERAGLGLPLIRESEKFLEYPSGKFSPDILEFSDVVLREILWYSSTRDQIQLAGLAIIGSDWLLGVSFQITTTTATATETPTNTPTSTDTDTPTSTASGTATSTATRTSTSTPTGTRTPTGTPSRTPYLSLTPSRTPFPTPRTSTPTLTGSATATLTPTPIPTATGMPTDALEPLPTIEYTLAISTSTPTTTPTPSPTPTPSITPMGPDQVIINLVQSGYFLRTILIILIIAVWGILAAGLFIYINHRR